MATGSTTVTPGYRFNAVAGERLDLSKINRLGQPTVRVDASSIGRRELQESLLFSIDGANAGISELWNVVLTADLALAERITTLDTTVIGLQTTIGGVQTTVTAHSGAISALTTRITAAEGEIDILASDVISLDSRLDTAEGNILAQATATSALTTRVTAAENSITALSTSVTNLSTTVNNLSLELDGVETTVAAHSTAINTLTTRITAAEGDIDILSSAVTALDSRLDTTEGDLLAQATATSALTTRVTAAEDDIEALSTSQTSLSSTVGTLSSTVTTQGSALATLKGDAEAKYAIKATAGNVWTGIELVSKAGATEISEIRFRGTLLDEDYVAGESGWKIDGATGDVELNNITARGRILSTKLGNDNTSFNPAYPNVDLPCTSSATSFNTTLAIVGVGAKAYDVTTAYNNWQYWIAEQANRQAAYDAMYADYDSDGYYNSDEPPVWVSGIDSTEQAALDAQMALVTAANTNRLLWLYRYGAATTPIDRVFGRSHMTFQVTMSLGYSAAAGDMTPKYRINGGASVSFGDYMTANYSNPQIVGTFPKTIDLALTDTIEFYPEWGASGAVAYTVHAFWSNQ